MPRGALAPSSPPSPPPLSLSRCPCVSRPRFSAFRRAKPAQQPLSLSPPSARSPTRRRCSRSPPRKGQWGGARGREESLQQGKEWRGARTGGWHLRVRRTQGWERTSIAGPEQRPRQAPTRARSLSRLVFLFSLSAIVVKWSQALRRACDGAGGAQAPRASLAHTRARARVREGCVIAGGFFLSRRKGVITTRDLARRYRQDVAEGRRTAGSSTVARGRPRGGGTRKPFRTSRLERSPV